MKRIIFFVIGLSLMSHSFAQETQDEAEPYRKYSIGLEFFNDIWMDKPSHLDDSWLNRGVSVFSTYNIKTKIKNIHFSPGLGITTRNLYSDAFLADTGWATSFETIPDSLSYSKNKLSVTYLDIPLELRYDPGDWHFALGFHFSYLLAAHTKYKGEDPSGGGYDVTVKRSDVRYLEPWVLGASARIGYRWVHLSAYYSLSKLFKKDEGPQMYPISVGITFMPFKYK